MRISAINAYPTSFGKIRKSSEEKLTKQSRFEDSKDIEVEYVGGYQPKEPIGGIPNPPISGSNAVLRGAARFDRDTLPEYPEDCSFAERDIEYVGGYQPKELIGGIPNPPTGGSIVVKK